MTDIERINVFEEKKREIIDRLVGNDNLPVSPIVEHKVIDVNWNRNKSWYDEIRLNANQNARNNVDQTIYQFMIRDNGGVVVTVSDETLSEEAPVVK